MNEETKRFILWISKVEKWRKEAVVLCEDTVPNAVRSLKVLWGARLTQWAADVGMYQGPFTDLAYIGYDHIQWGAVVKHFQEEKHG